MPPTTQLDLGRIVLVPVFACFVLLNVMKLIDNDDRTVVATLGTIAALSFNAALAVMYLRRGVASHTDRRPKVWLVAGAATFSPFAIPVVASHEAGPVASFAGALLVVLGIGLAIWALLSLNTNISVVPQARELATTGPYRFFRHPLYVFEYVAAIGLVLVSGGGWGWLVVAALGVLQVLRARWEERLLREEVAGYAAYASRTPGFS
ncbi:MULTISPECIES: methyltransferase family protein [unclassified Knoellia]|uniref:methyltransferase family protein n=1 Tax=Knoellia altitudinis TaxID=3404795 RepID=UPI003608F71D